MKVVTVRVPEKLTLEQSKKVLLAVLHKAGHPTCFSGFHINFETATDPAKVFMAWIKPA